MREKPVSYDLKNIFVFALQKYTYIVQMSNHNQIKCSEISIIFYVKKNLTFIAFLSSILQKR